MLTLCFHMIQPIHQLKNQLSLETPARAPYPLIYALPTLFPTHKLYKIPSAHSLILPLSQNDQFL